MVIQVRVKTDSLNFINIAITQLVVHHKKIALHVAVLPVAAITLVGLINIELVIATLLLKCRVLMHRLVRAKIHTPACKIAGTIFAYRAQQNHPARVCAKQTAIGAFQNLNTLHAVKVDGVEVSIAAGIGQRHFVKIYLYIAHPKRRPQQTSPYR